MPAGPLSGITVIDLTRVLAGPFSTMLLSELGARVIKVETPGTGDDARAYGPFKSGKSAYFISVNRGKESIGLNLKDEGDRAIFDSLLAGADVVVENFRPGTMEKLGYGWEDIHAKYPSLIYAACSGFGHTGPHSKRPAYDMVVQAMGGIMSITGQPGGEPTRVGLSIGDLGAGLYTTIGIISAIYDRKKHRRCAQGRCFDAGLPSVADGKRHRPICGYRRGSRAIGRTSPLNHAIPGVQNQGQPPDHRRRQRRHVPPASVTSSGARISRPTSASPPTAAAPNITRCWAN